MLIRAPNESVYSAFYTNKSDSVNEFLAMVTLFLLSELSSRKTVK